jgi:hypothetical protein
MLRENIAHGSWSSEDIEISNFFQRQERGYIKSPLQIRNKTTLGNEIQ